MSAINPHISETGRLRRCQPPSKRSHRSKRDKGPRTERRLRRADQIAFSILRASRWSLALPRSDLCNMPNGARLGPAIGDLESTDRKRGVSGKSGSVRVNLGGPGKHKKK